MASIFRPSRSAHVGRGTTVSTYSESEVFQDPVFSKRASCTLSAPVNWHHELPPPENIISKSPCRTP